MSATAAGTSTMRHWPRRRVLAILLVVSAVLNLFFIGGAVWTRLHAPEAWPNFEERYRKMAAELDLTAEQRTGFDRYVAAMRTRTQRMRQQLAPLIDTAWEDIAKPQANPQQIIKLFDDAAEKRREFQHEAMTETLDFLSLLSPAQRTRFVAIAREHRPSWMRNPQANR